MLDPGSVSSVQKCDCSGLLCACPQADGKFSYLLLVCICTVMRQDSNRLVLNAVIWAGLKPEKVTARVRMDGYVHACMGWFGGGGDSDNNLVVYWNILISHHCHPLTHGPGVLPLPASNP